MKYLAEMAKPLDIYKTAEPWNVVVFRNLGVP